MSEATPRHLPKPKPQLRNVRLEIPEEKVADLQNQSKIVQSNLEQRRRHSFTETLMYQIPLPTLALPPTVPIQPTVLYSPSPFLQINPNSRPEFIHEVFMPNTVKSFVSSISSDVVNGRFLLYVITGVEIPPTKIVITLNGIPIAHVLQNGQPLDITELLQPVNHTNWIVTDGNLNCPLILVGIWARYISLDNMVREIASTRPFVAPMTFDTCPISRSTIVYPAKGINCHHNECFDAYSFLTRAMALDVWLCPCCGADLPIEKLMIDASRNSSSFVSRASSECNLSSLLQC